MISLQTENFIVCIGLVYSVQVDLHDIRSYPIKNKISFHLLNVYL